MDCERVYADLSERRSLASALAGVDRLYQVAASLSDSVSVPPKCPKPFLLVLAWLLETAGRISDREPALTPHMVNSYFRDSHTLDLATSRADLGYRPHDPEQAIESAMRNLLEKPFLPEGHTEPLRI